MSTETMKDPVCGMDVDETDLPHEHEGRTYRFCNPKCRDKFKADPEHYLDGKKDDAPAAAAAAGVKYTCPMHPEIVQDGPGTCPICGMALEPAAPSAELHDDGELSDMKRRFGVSLALALPLFAVEMAGMGGMDPWLAPRVMSWAQLALATPVVLWGGLPFFERGWASITRHSLNMFTLIALGTGAAYFYSLVATAAPSMFPDSFRDPHGGLAGGAQAFAR